MIVCAWSGCTGEAPPATSAATREPAPTAAPVVAKAPGTPPVIAKMPPTKAPEVAPPVAPVAPVPEVPAVAPEALVEVPAAPAEVPAAPAEAPAVPPEAAPDDSATAPAISPESVPAAGPPEIAIRAWSTLADAPAWTLAAEPAEPLVLAGELRTGVLGRGASTWYAIDAAGALAVVTLDRDPKPPVLGAWPNDAWYVDTRFVKYGGPDDDMEYLEMRMMRLRGGKRWVPQDYHGSQWFHPGTDDEIEAHISTVAGMLLYPDSLGSITRIADRHGAPEIGPHRGTAIDFIENASGKVYVLSHDGDYFAQVPCEDEACVAANARKLPGGGWRFGRRIARGKHSVSVHATRDDVGHLLHHRGKSEGWILDELPAGERPTGMWSSEHGALWLTVGEKLRWRDVEGVWRDIALPDGLTAPSVAMGADRKSLYLSGVVGGAAKLYTTPADVYPAPP